MPAWSHLEGWLKDKLNQSFPKPTEFKNMEEFNYAAMATSSLKQSISEILSYVDMQKLAYKELTKKESEVKDPFSIGG